MPKIIRKLLLYPWRFVSGSHCEFPAWGLWCVWRHQIMTSVITISRVLAKAAEQSSLCSYLNIVFLDRYCLQNSKVPRARVCNFSTRIEMIRVFCFIDHLPRKKKKKTKKRAADDAVLQVFGHLSFLLQRCTGKPLSPLVQAQGWASLVRWVQAHFLWVTLTLWHWEESGLHGVLMGHRIRINVHSRPSKVEF